MQYLDMGVGVLDRRESTPGPDSSRSVLVDAYIDLATRTVAECCGVDAQLGRRHLDGFQVEEVVLFERQNPDDRVRVDVDRAKVTNHEELPRRSRCWPA